MSYERAKRQLAGRNWIYIRPYARAKTEVIATIMGHLGEESAR